MGNSFTIARVASVLPGVRDDVDARALLVDFLRGLAFNYFDDGSPEAAAHRVWVQVTDGVVESFSKEAPDFVLTQELKEDIQINA